MEPFERPWLFENLNDLRSKFRSVGHKFTIMYDVILNDFIFFIFFTVAPGSTNCIPIIMTTKQQKHSELYAFLSFCDCIQLIWHVIG